LSLLGLYSEELTDRWGGRVQVSENLPYFVGAEPFCVGVGREPAGGESEGRS